MKPESRKARHAKALAIGDPQSAVNSSPYNLSDINDALMRDASVAVDTSCYDLSHLKNALRSVSAAEYSIFDQSDGGSGNGFSRVSRSLRSGEKKRMKVSKTKTKKLLVTQLDPKLQQMIFLERSFISPILNSSSPLTPDQIRILTSILN